VPAALLRLSRVPRRHDTGPIAQKRPIDVVDRSPGDGYPEHGAVLAMSRYRTSSPDDPANACRNRSNMRSRSCGWIIEAGKSAWSDTPRLCNPSDAPLRTHPDQATVGSDPALYVRVSWRSREFLLVLFQVVTLFFCAVTLRRMQWDLSNLRRRYRTLCRRARRKSPGRPYRASRTGRRRPSPPAGDWQTTREQGSRRGREEVGERVSDNLVGLVSRISRQAGLTARRRPSAFSDW